LFFMFYLRHLCIKVIRSRVPFCLSCWRRCRFYQRENTVQQMILERLFDRRFFRYARVVTRAQRWLSVCEAHKIRGEKLI